jgi:conserved oligomeric Golgi complex subunit 6
LQALRVQSQEMVEELRQSHQNITDGLKKQHDSELAEQTGALQKKLASQALELKATQDDLSKAKSAVAAAVSEVEAIRTQLEHAQQSATALASSSSSEQVAEIERLLRELAAAKDDVTAHQEILSATKETIGEMTSNHSKELEEAAKGRAEEVTRMRGIHEAERESLRVENAHLSSRLSDLEGEITTLKAKLDADTPMSPKSNGAPPTVAQGVTKEELQRMHEAHNLKIRDLEAEHEKALKTLREEVEGFQSKAEELAAEVGRKAMEIQYLEQEQDEQTDTITRYVGYLGLKR